MYEEETSGQRDSMYVTEGYNDYSGYDFDTRIESALTGYEYHYWPLFASGSNSCHESGPSRGKCLFVKRSKGKPGDYLGEGSCFYINYIEASYSYVFNTQFPDNKIIVQKIYKNYPIQNFNFGETVLIHELNTFVEGKQPTNHFYSKNVGLIRKELLDSNQVWNLMNYHIEP